MPRTLESAMPLYIRNLPWKHDCTRIRYISVIVRYGHSLVNHSIRLANIWFNIYLMMLEYKPMKYLLLILIKWYKWIILINLWHVCGLIQIQVLERYSHSIYRLFITRCIASDIIYSNVIQTLDSHMTSHTSRASYGVFWKDILRENGRVMKSFYRNNAKHKQWGQSRTCVY